MRAAGLPGRGGPIMQVQGDLSQLTRATRGGARLGAPRRAHPRMTRHSRWRRSCEGRGEAGEEDGSAEFGTSEDQSRSPASRRRASMLVDVPRLVAAYYTARPDPAVPAQRVAFGTRATAARRSSGRFNEAHILAITQAICDYRARAGHRRPALPRHRHPRAVASRRSATALEVLAANGVEVMIDGRRRLHADAGDLARDPRPTTAAAPTRPGRRHRHHAVAQPAGGRRLQVQPAQRRPGRHRRHRLDRAARQRAARPAGCASVRAHAVRAGARGVDHAPARLPRRLRRRPRAASSTWRRSAARGVQHRRRSAGRRRRALLGARSPSATASTSPWSTTPSTRRSGS